MQNEQATTNQKNQGMVKRREEMSAHLSCQPPRIILAGISVWLSAAQVTRRDLSPNDGWRQPETVSHVAEQFSWVSSPCYSPPRCPMPRKPVCHRMCLLGHFTSKCQKPTLGSPFLQQTHPAHTFCPSPSSFPVQGQESGGGDATGDPEAPNHRLRTAVWQEP